MSPRPDRRSFGPGPYLLGAKPREAAPLDEFPFTLPAVAALESLRFDMPVTLLAGENGSGKSTLIESLARAAKFGPQGGTLSGELGRSSPDEMGIGDELEVEWGVSKPQAGFFLRAESFFNVARRIDQEELSGIYGGTDLHQQSHGESFIALAANRFGANSLFILDEPEAALSVTSALAFLGVMHRASQEGSQFIVATHSPVLLALPGARIYELGADGAHETAWEDTDVVRLTRSFLDVPDRFLRDLL